MFKQKQIITAIDIGSSKICVAIGECDSSNGSFKNLGVGESDSGDFVRKGEIRDVEEVSRRLESAIIEAEASSNKEVDPENIFYSVTGGHIRSQRGCGSVSIMNHDRKVWEGDAIEARKNSHQIQMPVDCTNINHVNADFLLDGSRRVQNPIGQTAGRLEALSYCIYGNISAINNYKSPIEACGYLSNKQRPIFSGLASSLSVFSNEDLDHGCLLLDIGAGTSEYALFHGSGCFHCGAIQIGCDHVANDLSIGLDLPISRTRKILLENFSSDDFTRESSISIDGSAGIRKIPTSSVEKIAEMRINEIFEVVSANLKGSNLKTHLARGVVICGGGAKFQSLIKCAEKFFDTTVRVGVPRDINGAVSKLNDPRYACVSGILKYGAMLRSSGTGNDGVISFFDKNLWSMISSFWRMTRDSIKF